MSKQVAMTLIALSYDSQENEECSPNYEGPIITPSSMPLVPVEFFVAAASRIPGDE